MILFGKSRVIAVSVATIIVVVRWIYEQECKNKLINIGQVAGLTCLGITAVRKQQNQNQ